MRFLLLLFLCSGLFALAASAKAVDAFDYHCADVALLQAKEIQKDLKINDAQRKKMNDAADTHRTRLSTYEQQQRAAKVKDTEAQQRTKLKGYYDELKKSVLTQLSATQLKRLRELTLQRAGLTAILDKVVAQKLGMSDAQLDKYRKVFESGAEKAAALERQTLEPILNKYKAMKPKTDAEKKSLQEKFQKEVAEAGKKAEPKMRALKNSTQKQLEAALTAAQRAKFKSLQGTPFKG